MANVLFDALFAPLAGQGGDCLILSDGTRIGGDAFLRMVARQAHALRAAGLVPGDRIAVQVGKSPEALATYGAALALGAVFLPLPAHHCCAALVCEALKGLVPDGGRVVNVCSCA